MLEALELEEGAPRTLDFKLNSMMLLQINAKQKYFPCNLSLDTSYANYEFFICFGNKTPTEFKYDAYF